MNAWLVIPVEYVLYSVLRMRHEFISDPQPSLFWPLLPPSKLFWECPLSTLKALQTIHKRDWLELKSQMSDTTANVFLNYDKTVFSLLHNSHPLVWQMCMLSVHSLIPRLGTSVQMSKVEHPLCYREQVLSMNLNFEAHIWPGKRQNLMENFRWQKVTSTQIDW